MALTDTLAEYGLDPMKVIAGLAAAIIVAGFLMSQGGGSAAQESEFELHPEHVRYMKEKEDKYCSGTFGKGLRCIIDFLREEDDDTTKMLFSETPKYTEGFEKVQIDMHPGQFDWLEEKGIKISNVEGQENKVRTPEWICWVFPQVIRVACHWIIFVICVYFLPHVMNLNVFFFTTHSKMFTGFQQGVQSLP